MFIFVLSFICPQFPKPQEDDRLSYSGLITTHHSLQKEKSAHKQYDREINLLTGKIVVPEVLVTNRNPNIVNGIADFSVHASTNPVFSQVSYENLRQDNFVSTIKYQLYKKTSLIKVETIIQYPSQ